MHMQKRGWSIGILVCVLLGFIFASTLTAFGQGDAQKKEPAKDDKFESKEPLPEKTIPPVPFWETDRSYAVRATMHMVGVGNPWHAIGVRIAASEQNPVIEGWNFDFDEVLPIYGRYLRLLQDGRELPVRDPKKPKELSDADKAMLLSYNQAIDRSHAATMDMFEKSALKFNYVKYSHLKSRPDEYRGKIITVEGRLKVIRKHPAPPYLREPLEHIYTGWIVGPHKTLPPTTIAFTDLPDGMRVSDSLDFPVKFMGYFIAFVKFPPDTPKQKEVISPYLIGKTFTLIEGAKVDQKPDGADGEKESYAYQYIIWTLGAIIVIAGLVASMNIWFRRGDDAVKSRLAEVRDKNQPFQLEDDTTTPPPLATPVAPPPDDPPPV